MKYKGIGQSHAGKRRAQNEDAFVADDDLGLYAVSDGMGGHAAGEVASARAIRSVSEVVAAELSQVTDRDGAVALVRRSVERACHDVYTRAATDASKAGMGCTLTVAILRDGYAAVGHVGASRGYLYRDDDVSQLTADHTVGAELMRAGLSTADEISNNQYARALSRVVGTHAAVKVDAFSIDMIDGDILLLCSDGLSRYIPSTEWLAEQLRGSTLDATAEELIQHANDEGGRDNITTVIVGLDATDEQELERRRAMQISGRLEALGSVFLFESLSTGLLAQVLSHCDVGCYDDGEPLIAAGESLNRLVVVVEGNIAIAEGERREQLRPGDVAGITALLEPRRARATLVASGPATVISLSHERFWMLAKKRPWLGITLIERLNKELGRTLNASISRRDDGARWTTPLMAVELL